ncbi:hypothetical protein FZC79_00800 [Rossellomorea vietnamensis]|uniref:Uncharacterized protein n=1 Tax=Rossellomorea vietnamensis TaxID=218284 RepID=A0A5D4KM49_9BACI|nr:hypothetical protein [Rossellomorea vietnamensis]TYR77393.1 hypothetical protein FZC79_00800 [Rossellomorea vietnamensis]
MKKISYGVGLSLLLLAGCGTAEESTEANPAEAQAVKETQEETFETASTDKAVNGDTEEAEMTKEKAAEVLRQYEDTFMEVIDKGPELKEYESRDEIIQQFSTIMTKEQAEDLADIYINDKDGTLSVVATEAPIWLKYDQDYNVEKISEGEYHVIQNNSSELRGNLEVTFVLVLDNDSWLVSKTKTDNKEKTEPEGNNNAEAEGLESEKQEDRIEDEMDFK